MAILVTGGTGKTSLRLAHLLEKAKIPFLLTSRRGPSSSSSYPTIRFDWNDSSTWSPAFSYSFPNNQKITAVYLVSGELSEPAPILNAFIRLAAENGVKRFVLCSGSSCVKGGPFHGKIWQTLADQGFEYCVLRPSWFMQNFSERGQGHFETVREQGCIYSACGDGKIRFVSADDIAAVAFRALVDEKSHDCAYRILGPEGLTYDQIAEKLGTHLGRTIKHVKLSPERRIQGFIDAGLPSHLAGFLTSLETMAAEGRENWEGNDVEIVTGEKAVSFDEFLVEHRAIWG